MLCVYIAGPIQGPTLLDSLANIGRGKAACARVLEAGMAPHPLWADHEIIERCPGITIQQVYAYSAAWLRKADAVLMLPGWERSRGAQRELAEAEELGIPVFYSEADLSTYASEHARQIEIMRRDDA